MYTAGSSRLNGLDPQMIKLLTYVIPGVCVAVAGTFFGVLSLNTSMQ